MLDTATEMRKLIVLKLEEPDAVVLCASDPVSVKYIEEEFSVYLSLIQTEDTDAIEYKPPASTS